jgi:hypothetical protein
VKGDVLWAFVAVEEGHRTGKTQARIYYGYGLPGLPKLPQSLDMTDEHDSQVQHLVGFEATVSMYPIEVPGR